MDERVRRRKSLWEAEEGNLRTSWSGKENYSTYDIGHSHKFSSSKVNNSLIPKDQAYAGERMYKGGLDEHEMREQGLNKNYYKSMSPGFDGWDRGKGSDSRDDGLSQSRRYREGRSRSRDRGRSRSSSRSWSGGRDRDGIRSRSRSRSRSRNRNRNRNRARDQTRSRSPFYDRRRESHGWSDRSGLGISSQICKDFAAGNCRRGSQCRFLHPDGMEGDCSEDDVAERWRSRPERGRTLRYGEGPGMQSWDGVTDSSYGEDDSRNKSRGKICCKDFIRGKCQWGASCRFSHHIGSGDNIAKSTRNASFGRDHQHQRRESGKPLCKYFLAGKCNRDNCWFVHDDSAAGNHERRPHEEGGRHSLSVENGGWNGPTWAQTLPEPNIAKGTRWSERVVVNQNTNNAVPSERMDNKCAPEGRTRGSPEWEEKASESSTFISTHEWNEDNGRDLGAVKSLITGNLNDIQEYPPISQGLELVNLDAISTSSHAQIATEEASRQHLPTATVHNDVSLKSDTKNLLKAFSYDGLGEAKELRSTMNPEFIPRQSPNPNAVGNLDFNQSLLVSKDLRDNLFFSHPPNVQNFDLNGPGQVLPLSLNLQNHPHGHQKEAAKTHETPEFGAHQSFFSSASNGQVAQFFPSPTVASPMQKYEQAQAHLHTALNSLTSTTILPTLQSAVHIQPNPMSDGRGQNMGGNSDQTSGYSFEQKNQIPLEQFSPMSCDGIELKEDLPSGSSMVQLLDSPKSKLPETPAISEFKEQETTVVAELKEQQTLAISELKEQGAPAVVEVKHNSIKSAAEREKGKENISKENGGHGKAEDGIGNKEDKDMRVFKNALVESVKEILKPKWKLGGMSRDVHKTIVKKVVDKVTSTIQADHIPKTRDKIDQYLSYSKTKISKLVQAYVDRHLKTDS